MEEWGRHSDGAGFAFRWARRQRRRWWRRRKRRRLIFGPAGTRSAMIASVDPGNFSDPEHAAKDRRP